MTPAERPILLAYRRSVDIQRYRRFFTPAVIAGSLSGAGVHEMPAAPPTWLKLRRSQMSFILLLVLSA